MVELETTPPASDAFEEDTEHDDAASSAHGSSYVGSLTEKFKIGHTETKHIFYIRALVIVVLLAVSITISLVVYQYSSEVEEDTFEQYFREMASKLTSEFIDGASRRIAAIEGLSELITAYVVDHHDMNWPNVVIPEFERLGTRTMLLSDVLSIVLLPIVTTEQRASWEAFSIANQEWFQEGLDLQGIPEEDYNQEWIDGLASVLGYSSVEEGFPKELFRISPDGPVPETGIGPYAPYWQVAPVIPNAGIINYNSFSYAIRGQILDSVIESKKSIVTMSWDYGSDEMAYGRIAGMNLFLQHGGNTDGYDPGPGSDIYVPVFESFDNDTVAAELSAAVYWQKYFEDVLLEGDVGIYVVLENTCGQSFTYRVDGGDVTYIGEGNLHDTHYNHLAVYSDYGSFTGAKQASEVDTMMEGQCDYRVVVYPSVQLEDTFTSNDPVRFALILAGTVVFTSVVFLLYDYLVERRQRLMMHTAVKSTAVVDSLFPEEVRDRLYDNNGNAKKAGKSGRTSTFLRKETPEQIAEEEDNDPSEIADLYPNCTVFFCDMVGFTKWSSTREPKDVFKLLETVYKSFDKAARRLEVFKVETVGDCYVAATGIPHPQETHAAIMANFAAECLEKASTVTHRLASSLGPDTAELAVRIGMHSGPVTAGVLRGAKARFQLFGDTVNTAARMESTGAPSRIHLSATTAELLRVAGHGAWVSAREDQVTAKGKGQLQTYWLNPALSIQNLSSSMENSAEGSD